MWEKKHYPSRPLTGTVDGTATSTTSVTATFLQERALRVHSTRVLAYVTSGNSRTLAGPCHVEFRVGCCKSVCVDYTCFDGTFISLSYCFNKTFSLPNKLITIISSSSGSSKNNKHLLKTNMHYIYMGKAILMPHF